MLLEGIKNIIMLKYIGYGLANGDWNVIYNIIKNNLIDCDILIVDYERTNMEEASNKMLITRKKIVNQLINKINNKFNSQIKLETFINEEDGFYNILYSSNENVDNEFESFVLNEIKELFYKNGIYSIYFGKK